MVKFVDIYNYLNPDTSYVQWVKTYGAKLSKSLYFSGGLSVHLASVWGEGNEHVR